MKNACERKRWNRLTILKRLALALCLTLLIGSFSGCELIRVIIEPLPTFQTLSSETLYWPSSAVSTTTAEQATTTATLATQTKIAQPTQSGQTTKTPDGLPGDAFRSQVTKLIVAGLNSVSREIVLDEALTGLQIPESSADATIELVFDLFQNIYYSQPQYYFLSGQANANYVILRSTNATLKSLTIKLDFIDSADKLNTAAIKARQKLLEQTAANIAANAKKQGTGAVQQLLYIHDYLIQNIQYDLKAVTDTSLNRERSNAASALLDHLALCQGYAAAFQLTAQQLGYDVKMPTGTAGGISHAWNLVKVDGQYYHIDLTYDDPTPDGGPTAPVEHIHFLRSDARMRETHVWKAQDYPTAPNDGAQYYRENSLLSATRTDLQSRVNRFVADLPKTIQQAQQLELLYTGKDLPTVTELEKILQTALTKAKRSGQILYSRRVDKQVVRIEFLPA